MRSSASKWAALVFILVLLGSVLAYAGIIAAVDLFGVSSDSLLGVARVLIWSILAMTIVLAIVATVNTFTEWSKVR